MASSASCGLLSARTATAYTKPWCVSTSPRKAVRSPAAAFLIISDSGKIYRFGDDTSLGAYGKRVVMIS